MEKSKYIIYLFFILLFGYQCYDFGRNSIKIEEPIETVRIDTTTVRDTITIEKPVLKYIAKAKTIIDTLKTTDTIPQFVEVEIPIESKVYEDSDYYCRISGYKANLDNLRVYPKETVITTEKVSYIKDKGVKIRPSINVGYGYGIINNKSDVFIGVGASIIWK